MMPREAIVLLLLAGLAAAGANADTFITMKEGSHQVESMPEVPRAGNFSAIYSAGEQTVHYWYRADRMTRIEASGHRSMIGRLDRGRSYLIDDDRQSCFTVTHDDPVEEAAGGPTPGFRKTGQTQQIGPWQAEGYELTATAGSHDYRVTIWVSGDVTTGLEDYRAYTRSTAAPEMAWTFQALELGGYPVRTEILVGSTLSWSEIVSVEDKPAPPATYEAPDGYRDCE